MTDPMPTDFRALCAELVDALEEWARGQGSSVDAPLIARVRAALEAQPEPVAPTTPSEWHLLSLEQPSLNALCEYICHANNWGVVQGKGKWHEQTNPTVSGFTNSHGLFVSDSTQTLWRLAQPEPQGPMDEELLDLAEDCDLKWFDGKRSCSNGSVVEEGRWEAWDHELLAFARAVLTHWGRPAIEPVPVSERLPGPEDCDAEGRCWWWNPTMNPNCPNWWSFESTEYIETEPYWLPHWALPVPGVEGE